MPKPDEGSLSTMARWAHGIAFGDLSDAAAEQARLLVLDAIGCACAALDEPVARAAAVAIVGQGGAPQASVIGFPGRNAVGNAVLANGVLVRFLDLNDYFVEATEDGVVVGGHPSDNIPVALAAGEMTGSTGRDVITAIVVGYEIYARLKSLMDGADAWDGTTVSGFVAAAMAGRLFGLDPVELAHAMALGGARSPTSALMRSGDISSGKFLANALVAQSATTCAILAQHGMTGPLVIFDHPRGLQPVFPKAEPGRAWVAPEQGQFAIMHSTIKSYPCVATSQTLVAAALSLRGRLQGGAAAIERITVTMLDNATIRRQQSDPVRLDPRSREAADHSFLFLAAVALADGALTPRQFENERWHDPAIRRLMARVTMGTDPAMEGDDATGFPCRLEVETRDGAVHREEVSRLPGATGHGLDRQAVVEKFHRVAAMVDEDEREAIVGMVLGLEDMTSIAPLMERLAALGAR